MSKTLEYAKQLIQRQSVTPNDGGCHEWIKSKLDQLGFVCEPMQFGEVNNLWATFGSDKPLFVFAGHVDVVPTGPVDKWHSPPFEPTIRNGLLYGRGSADMKSSIAAMMVAVEEFLKKYPEPNINIAFLTTADEEGPAIDGTVKVIERLIADKLKINWCLVGEPTAIDMVGDVVKNGRRGSFDGQMTIIGVQGHVAYPHLSKNPVHYATKAIDEFVNTEWDQGNDSFPPTSMQISNVKAGTGATNVSPGEYNLVFNFRFCTEQTQTSLATKTEDIFNRHGIDYDINWNLSANPYLSKSGELTKATQEAIKKVMGFETELSTSGGTSDGRFIAPMGVEVLEVGPVNASIHQINENINLEQLDKLTEIYLQILINLNNR